MKKKNLRRTLAWMLSSFFLVSCANETVIYVDSSAKTTTADGGIDAPFTTVEEALAQVRQLREDGNRDAVSVVFRSGQYFFDRGFLLDEAMSNLQLKAYPQEMVVFTGGVKTTISCG